MEQSQIPPQLSNDSLGPARPTPSKDGDAAPSSPPSGDTAAEPSHLDVSAACDTSRESDLSAASPEREFSIRATNFDRGQLKLRIASKRVNKKTPSALDKECASDSGDESTELCRAATKNTEITVDNEDNAEINQASAPKKVSHVSHETRSSDAHMSKC